MKFDVRADLREVNKTLQPERRKKAIGRATTRAINKVAKIAEKQAVRELSADIGISQRNVRKYLRRDTASINSQEASIRARGKRLSLLDLGARQIGKRNNRRDASGQFKAGRVVGRGGVRYKGQGGARRFIPGAFIADMPNGGRGVFRRRGVERLPIDKMQGPSVPYVFMRNKIQRAIDQAVRTRWRAIFDHEVDWALRQAGFR